VHGIVLMCVGWGGVGWGGCINTHTHRDRLSEEQQERIKSDNRDSIVPEPMFWAHYDHDATTTKITLVFSILWFLIFFYHDATTTKITLFSFYL